jgi:hypothetical protein
LNQLFVDILRVRIRSLLAASSAIDSIAHEGLKGRIREMFVNDLVAPFLPSFAGVGTGKIVDSENGQSAECDVVIYDKDTMPPLMLGPREALFPIESVFNAIEVKTTLSSGELRDATAKARRVKDLKNSPPRYPEGHGYDAILSLRQDSLRPAPVCCLFAFGSDMTGEGKTELQRYQEILDNAKDGIPYIGSLCVVNRAAHIFASKSGSNDAWHTVPTDSNGAEVLWFLASIVDSIPGLRLRRGYPAWSNYIVQY